MDNFFPVEITLDILSRLPVESVLQCRCVCRTWRTLLRYPSFAYMHLRLDDHNAAATKVGLLSLPMVDDKKNTRIYYLEYDDNDNESYKKLTSINLHPPANICTIVGTCNGLICISVTHHCTNDPVYICNPITRECMNLPKLDTGVNQSGYEVPCLVISGFGYLPSTNEYKVVRIFYINDQPIGRVQVYTLGDGNGWRNKGEISYSLFPRPIASPSVHSPSIVANGALHWLDKEEKIVAFDIADEEFSLLPSPPCFLQGECNYFQLQVLGRTLCVVQQTPPAGGTINIWSLKKNVSNSNMKGQDHIWSWSREFSFTLADEFHDVYEPFKLTKSGKVLLYNHEILFRYDLKTETLEYLVDLDAESCFEVDAVPYVKSFISLKDLGEEDTKTIGYSD